MYARRSFILNYYTSNSDKMVGFTIESSQLIISVITFVWVQQQTHPKVMSDMLNWLEVHS